MFLRIGLLFAAADGITTVLLPERNRRDFDDVVKVLETEGVDKFKKSWDELVETVQGQMDQASA